WPTAAASPRCRCSPRPSRCSSRARAPASPTCSAASSAGPWETLRRPCPIAPSPLPRRTRRSRCRAAAGPCAPRVEGRLSNGDPQPLSVRTPSRTPMSPHTPARRYLVTGGRGFIGRHLLARLAAQGAEVHATTRSATPPADPHVRWWRVDLADAVATEELVTRLRPDVVVHLAARADGTRRLDAVVPILTDTLLSTVSVLAAAARLPECKVVLAGSVEDGGHQPDVHSPYAASKAAAATYATLFHGLWQLDVTVLRLAMVYGPDDPNAHRLIPSVVAAFADGRRAAVGSGTRRIDWVYVEDVVDAFLAAAAG